MTITVTVPELEQYQVKVREWAYARAKHSAELADKAIRSIHSRGDPFLLTQCASQPITGAMEKWDKENPFPKILPYL